MNDPPEAPSKCQATIVPLIGETTFDPDSPKPKFATVQGEAPHTSPAGKEPVNGLPTVTVAAWAGTAAHAVRSNPHPTIAPKRFTGGTMPSERTAVKSDGQAEHWSHGWIAVCPCGWLGDDRSTEEDAAEDAELHSEGKRRPWNPETFVEWDQRGAHLDAT